MTSIHARILEPEGVHARVLVFAGPDEGHRALTGSLTMRVEEATRFEAMVRVFPEFESLVEALVTAIRRGYHLDDATIRSMLAERWPHLDLTNPDPPD